MASLNPQPRMKEKFCYHLCALKNRQEIIHFSRVCELLSTTLDLMSQLKKRTDVSILTCSQVAAHSKMGILPTATAMETNLPNNIMRFSSAWLPWRLKSAENMSRRTLSRLCSWKQLHMISRSWSSWRALILCKKEKVVIFHLCCVSVCICAHACQDFSFTLPGVFLSFGACRMNSSTNSNVLESTWGGCLPDCTMLQM